MKNFTEDELEKIANDTYDEISNKSDSDFSNSIVDICLNTMVNFISKLQNESEE